MEYFVVLVAKAYLEPSYIGLSSLAEIKKDMVVAYVGPESQRCCIGIVTGFDHKNELVIIRSIPKTNQPDKDSKSHSVHCYDVRCQLVPYHKPEKKTVAPLYRLFFECPGFKGEVINSTVMVDEDINLLKRVMSDLQKKASQYGAEEYNYQIEKV